MFTNRLCVPVKMFHLVGKNKHTFFWRQIKSILIWKILCWFSFLGLSFIFFSGAFPEQIVALFNNGKKFKRRHWTSSSFFRSKKNKCIKLMTYKLASISIADTQRAITLVYHVDELLFLQLYICSAWYFNVSLFIFAHCS